jgi:hypothetical protein
MQCTNSNCNQLIKDNSKFCPYCGEKVRKIKKPAPISAPTRQRLNPFVIIISIMSAILVFLTIHDLFTAIFYSLPVFIFCTIIPLITYMRNDLNFLQIIGLVIVQLGVIAVGYVAVYGYVYEKMGPVLSFLILYGGGFVTYILGQFLLE